MPGSDLVLPKYEQCINLNVTFQNVPTFMEVGEIEMQRLSSVKQIELTFLQPSFLFIVLSNSLIWVPNNT